MKRKSGGRSYLQQLAQPVLPGATVLTAHSVSATFAAETAPQVPLTEDRFNFPDETQPAPAHASVPIHRPAQRQHSPIEAAERLPQSDAIDESPANESPRIVAHSAKLPRVSAEPGRISSSDKAASAPAPLPHVLSAREERTVERSIRAETHKAVTNRKEPATPRTPQSPPKGENSRSEKHTAHARTERHNDLPVTQESVRELIASSKAIKDAPSSLLVPEKHIAERKEIRQASNAAVAPVPAQEAPKQKAEKPEVRKSEGPRVHIGTVEIRAVLPQPAVPQPAVMAANYAQNIAPAQSRGRSSAAEPLARGLDWSYGLVQG